MTIPPTLFLGRLPHLGQLFELFNAGKQLNRIAEPVLWAELENEQDQYQTLFASLGFELRVDGRGFAWFHFDNASSNVSRTTRQLALLFMLLFELKADEGIHLERFTDWLINRELLAMLAERGHDLLQAEGLDEESLAGLFDRACTHGFAELVAGGWRLLPAVWRYLDHFEALASQHAGNVDDSDAMVSPDEASEEDEAP
ncbi:TPA: hypothetical protein ACHY2P_006461 [Pseudomonas aeruginosa]|uniref:condensin complex protein MksE n=1 Tax=Pseudomonas aeruginosa TaxID=287 RepID=UPI000E314434|nr:hypothetical protein [Pseudomonas aeruginosa]NPX94444.1 hypothetical protein [Pseudomonas aeruginosa]